MDKQFVRVPLRNSYSMYGFVQYLRIGNFQKVMILELALSSKHDLFCGTNPAKILVGKGPVKI